MDWTKQNAINKVFGHITTSESVESIKKKGLIQSEYGQQGRGLYSIEKDYDVLDSVVELLEQEKYTEGDLIAVEFNYSGDYFINPIDMLVEASEDWVLIPSDINSNNILQYTPISGL